MPAIPESTRSSIILRLLDHAEHNWPQLAKVQARYHGSFAYITGVLPGGEQIPLFRLRYGGSAHSFGFAIYSPARDRYEDAVLLTGLPIGSPQEALDTACTLHLAALGHEPESWPPTDLRCHPLSRPFCWRMSHYAGQLLVHFAFLLDQIGGRLSGVTQVQLTVRDEEADEIAQRVDKTLLKPAPDDARSPRPG